jgi:hypothetical protein
MLTLSPALECFKSRELAYRTTAILSKINLTPPMELLMSRAASTECKPTKAAPVLKDADFDWQERRRAVSTGHQGACSALVLLRR